MFVGDLPAGGIQTLKNNENLHTRDEAFQIAWRQLDQTFQVGQDLEAIKSEDSAWRKVSVGKKTVLKRFDSFARLCADDTTKLSIGHSLRFHVIRMETWKSWNNTKFFDQIEAIAEERRFGLGGNSHLAAALDPFSNKGPASELSANLQEACVHLVNLKLRSGKQPLLRVKDIFEGEFCGPDALINFAYFLRGEERRTQPFIGEFHYGENGAPREELASRVMNAIHSQSDGPVLCNIYSNRMWHGLSAFGTWLAGKLTHDAENSKDDRINLYLPVGRFWNAHPDRIADEAPGYRIFLGRLLHFFCAEMNDLANAKAISATDDINEVLHEIRKGMIKRPRILILNGVYTKKATKTVAGIERFIASDMALEILSVILDPALCAFDSARDFEKFNRNRIVVLSNEDLSDVDVWTPSHPNITVQSYPLPEPAPEDVPAVLRSQKLACVEQVLEKRDQYRELTRSWQDAEYHLLSCLLNLCKKAALSNIDEVFSRLVDRQTDYGHETGFIRPLMDEIIAVIPKEKVLLSKLLFIIASAPDGLRQSTLQRLAHFSLNAKQEHGWITQNDINEYARHSEINTSRTDVIKTATMDLLASFEGVLRLDVQDFYAGVDTLAHALEFEITPNLFGSGSTDRSPPVSIVFASPILREVARDALAALYDSKTFHFCHRILSEDALLQQAVALRHAETHESQSIYHWRRQIAGIYHGLCSLPLLRTHSRSVEFKTIGKDANQFPALTPNRPKAFWRWLYLFAYRRMIEQPPVYAMSRVYGRDRLKRDILMAFGRPWDLWPSDMKRQSQLHVSVDDLFLCDYYKSNAVSKQSQDQTLQDKSAQRAVVARAFHFSLFQSNHILGDTAAMRGSLEKLNAYPPDSEDLPLALGVLKRRLDLKALELTPIQDVDLDVFEMENVLELALTSDGIHAIEAAVEDSIVGYLECLLDSSSQRKLPHSFKAARKQIQKRLPASLGSNVEGIASVADILFRVAENHATQADCTSMPTLLLDEDVSAAYAALDKELTHRKTSDRLEEAGTQFREEADRPFRLCHTRAVETPVDVVIAFSQAHALFMLAEALRLSSFAKGPLSGKFFASGHAMRTMIRVGLKLEALRRRLLDLKRHPLTSLGPFVTQVRRDSDTMTRHMFRYPRERATQLVTEASTLRLLVGENANEKSLMIARNLLSRAEPATAALSGHSRHRFRLSLERGKLHRQLARTVLAQIGTDPNKVEELKAQANFYTLLAEWDLALLKAASETKSEIKVWGNTYERQRMQLEQLRQRLQ